MNLPEGTQLTYFDYRRAWFRSDERAISVSADVSEPCGGQGWSFEVAEVDMGAHGTAIQVRVYEDAFTAFTDLPEFFRDLDRFIVHDLDDVLSLLQELGAVDRTATEAPYPPEAAALEKAAAVIRSYPRGTGKQKESRALAAAILAELGISPQQPQ